MKKSVVYGVFFLLMLAIVGAGFYFFGHSRTSDETDENKDVVAKREVQPGGTEDIFENDSVAAIPNLDRPIIISPDIPEATEMLARTKIEEISSALKENNKLFSHWLDLGIYRKIIEDFEGAKEAWIYASALQPDDARPYNNLADLAIYYVHDNQAGEHYLLKAIEKSPDQLYYYNAAFEFYYYVLKDEHRAKAMLEQGIAKNPNASKPLQDLLNSIQ